MLSRSKREPTDITLFTLAHSVVVNDIIAQYGISEKVFIVLTHIHGLQRVYNSYVSLSELVPFVGQLYNSVSRLVKVLIDRGFISKKGHLYNVDPNGLEVIRAYETRISRRYTELRYKHKREWKHIPASFREQKENRQYPAVILDANKRVKVLGYKWKKK